MIYKVFIEKQTLESHDDFYQVGGQHISVWVEASSPEEAQKKAKETHREKHFKFHQVSDPEELYDFDQLEQEDIAELESEGVYSYITHFPKYKCYS